MNPEHTIPIVIADDESSIRNGLALAIPWNELHMSVAGIAKDGLEAWNFIQVYKPDIVITDIRMPQMSGLDLIKKCREHHLDIQFIILSGYDEFSYAQTAMRYGARAYVLKPLKIEELIAELENLKEELIQKNRLRLHNSRTVQPSAADISRIQFLNQLVHHEFHHNSDIQNRCKELSMRLDSPAYQIVIFSAAQNGKDSVFGILPQIKELILETTASYGTYAWEEGGTHIIVLFPLADTADPSPAHQAAEDCLALIKTRWHCAILAALGSVEQALIDTGRSYSMALTALSYQLYEPDRDLYDQTILCTQAPAASASNIDTAPLVHAIRKNDREAITGYCSNFFQALFYVPLPPPSFVRGMSIYLITDIQNLFRKQVEEDLNLFSESNYIRINQLATLTQIKEWVLALFLQYGEVISKYLDSRKDTIILEAKNFIETHMNQRLQVEDVASIVNLSPSYFPIYFKSKTGINFRDYVLNIKMEHAKHLLETVDANISEIAYAVGYDDYRSFYRAFKNHTGLTPSEYQTKH